MYADDNGPRDGDFVRYIDELTARVAAKHAAATTPAITEVAAVPKPRPGQVAITPKPHRPTAQATMKPAQPAPAIAPPTLAIGALFNVVLFVGGALLFSIGFIATNLGFLVVIGAALLAWGMRRTKGGART